MSEIKDLEAKLNDVSNKVNTLISNDIEFDELSVDGHPMCDNDLPVEKELTEEEKNLKIQIDNLTKEHSQHASLAFELLKSMLHSGKVNIAQANTALVQVAYQYADAFKQTVDTRFTDDLKNKGIKIRGI